MASKKKKAAKAASAVSAAKAAKAAKNAKDNAYVQRLVEDDDLRDQIVEAYESVRDVYDRISSGKANPARQLIDDKKLQKQIREAAENIRDAGDGLRSKPSKKKSGGLFRKVAVLAVAGGLALALSEDLRKKVLDLLFGAEEEFEYTSTTTPSSTNAGPTTAGGPAPDAAGTAN